jgi:hypothetical protein
MRQVRFWRSLEYGLEYMPPRAVGDEMSEGLATWRRAQSVVIVLVIDEKAAKRNSNADRE